MGFFDSLKGFGRALEGLVGGVLESPIGQRFAELGFNILEQRAFPQGPTPIFRLPGGAPARFPTPPPAFPGPARTQPFPQPFRPFPVSGAPSGTPGVVMAGFPGFQRAEFDIPFVDIVPQGQGACGFGNLFRPGVTGGCPTARPSNLVVQCNPVTGEPAFFGNLGRPILFSRDMAVARKVSRLAMRAKRTSTRRVRRRR